MTSDGALSLSIGASSSAWSVDRARAESLVPGAYTDADGNIVREYRVYSDNPNGYELPVSNGGTGQLRTFPSGTWATWPEGGGAGTTNRMIVGETTITTTAQTSSTEAPLWWTLFADYFGGIPWLGLVAIVIAIRGAFRRSAANPRGLSVEARIAKLKMSRALGELCGNCRHPHFNGDPEPFASCGFHDPDPSVPWTPLGCLCMAYRVAIDPPERIVSHPQADHCEECGRRKVPGSSCVACRLPVLAEAK